MLSVQLALARCCISIRRMVLNTRSGLVFVYKQVLLESFKPSLLSNHHQYHLLCTLLSQQELAALNWRVSAIFGNLRGCLALHIAWMKPKLNMLAMRNGSRQESTLSHPTAQIHQAAAAPSRPASRPAHRLKARSHDHSYAVCPCLRERCGDAERHSRSAAARDATLDPIGSHPGAKPRG